jgi:hypothetical protein
MSDTNNSDRATILGTLRRVDRRVRLNEGFKSLTVAVCVLLSLLLVLQILGALFPVPLPSAGVVCGLWGSLVAGYWLWRSTRSRPLGRAAGISDRRANLKDELKTAYWFIGKGEPTPWTDYQAGLAAGTAARLDPVQLVPVVVPRGTYVAAALAVLFVFSIWAPLPDAGTIFGAAAGLGGLGDNDPEQVSAIEELMAQAALLDESDELLEERAISKEARERLEEALRRLEENELSLEEMLREMQEARNLLEEGNLDMSTLQEGLEDLGKDLEGSDTLDELADALQNQELEEAADLLRELAEKLAEMDATDQLGDLAERMAQLAPSDQQELEDLLAALREASEALGEQDAEGAEQALQDAADLMEALADRMKAQDLMNQASQQLPSLEQAMAQQAMSMDPEQLAELLSQLQQEGEGGEQVGMSMASDEVQWQSGGDEEGDASEDPQGGPSGHATGDPLGGDVKLGDPTRLEVQLEVEVLDTGEEPEPPRPENIFEEESRQEDSALGYGEVRQRSTFAEEDVMSAERIPWRYRNLVKLYFLAIRPRDENGH